MDVSVCVCVCVSILCEWVCMSVWVYCVCVCVYCVSVYQCVWVYCVCVCVCVYVDGDNDWDFLPNAQKQSHKPHYSLGLIQAMKNLRLCQKNTDLKNHQIILKTKKCQALNSVGGTALSLSLSTFIALRPDWGDHIKAYLRSLISFLELKWHRTQLWEELFQVFKWVSKCLPYVHYILDCFGFFFFIL